MALYDTPPSIDPRTGRLPTYKQVLKQDPATGVYKIKYEYTPIVSASTDGVDLQKMLTTPITELDVDPVTSDDKDDDTGEDTTTATQMTTTGSGGGPRGNDPRGEGPFVGGGAGGFNADNAVDPNSLEGLMSAAYPGTGAKVANFVFGKVLSGVNPLLGAGLGFLNQANQEKAEQKIKDQIEDGTIAKGLSTSQIEALAEDKNIPGYLSDAFSNILDSSGMVPTRRPTQPGATTPQDVGALSTDLFSGSITERREGEETEAAAEAAREKALLDELERRREVERELAKKAADKQKEINDQVASGLVGYGYDPKTGNYKGVVTYTDRFGNVKPVKTKKSDQGGQDKDTSTSSTPSGPTGPQSGAGSMTDQQRTEAKSFRDPSSSKGDGGSGQGGQGGGGPSGCFVEGTAVQMADGTTKEITSIEIGEETRGGIVQAKMEFMPQNIYNYKGVLVSGSHWVIEDNQFIEVEDSKHGILTDRVEPVYTFKTSNNRIWIHDIEFGDFETGSDDDWAPYFEKVKQNLNKKLRGEA
jgi:hypothetical protein